MVTAKKKTNKKNISSIDGGTDVITYKNWIPIIMFCAVAVLIFYPPYCRGLFFKEDMFVYHILTALVFILLWVDKIRHKDYTFIRTPLDYAVLAYAVAYLLSLIGAVHIGEGIYGFLRALNLFMIYWMISQVVKDFNDYEKLLQVILAAATGVAIIGLLALAGYFKYHGALQAGQIASTLQYSNTLAAYLGVVSLIGITLWVRARNKNQRFIYGTTSFILMLVTLCSQSKGAWIIFAIGLFLLIIGFPNRAKASCYTLIALATALLISSKITALAVGAGPRIILLVLLGVVIITGVQFLGDAIIYFNNKIKLGKPMIVIGLVIVLATGIALAKSQDVIPQLGNISVIKDIGNLGNSLSYTSRMDFNRWALAIVKDYPVVGAGAGGWNALYHEYQDYLTYTSEVHNHFLQVWVEAGTIGLLSFIVIWLAAIFYVVRVFKARRIDNSINNDHWILIWGTMAAALALGFHSAIDFDLSLAAISILLWSLFALINSACGTLNIRYNLPEKPAANLVLATVAAFVLLFLGSSYLIAFNSSQSATGYLEKAATISDAEQQNEILNDAEKGYLKAVSLDPYNGTYHANLAQVYAIRYLQFASFDQGLSKNYYQKAIDEINRAATFSYYDIKTRSSLLNTSWKLNNIDLAITHAEAIMQITPNDSNAYNALIKVIWTGADAYIKANKPEEAVKLAEKLVAVENKLMAQKSRINPDRAIYWQVAPLEFSPESQFNIACASYLLGDYNKAKQKMAAVAVPLLNGNMSDYIWCAAILYKTGDIAEAEQLIGNIKQSNPDFYKQFEQLLSFKTLK